MVGNMAFFALHNEQKNEPRSEVSTTSDTQKNERIFTIPNMITCLRLFLVPVVFVLIIGEGNNLLAFSLFALAALTDFVDGYIARKTNTVTEFGKAIDPLVDRLLIAAGVLALFTVGKLPLWILVFIISRDIFLLSGLAIVRKITVVEIKIRNIGKLTTTALLIGFAGLILGVWTVPAGLGWTDSAAFPGFTSEPYLMWMWFIYAGLIFSFMTLIVYIWDGFALIKQAKTGQEETTNEAK